MSAATFRGMRIYMLNSTAHWMPLVNGYSDHIPQDFRDTVLPLSSFPTRESFQILGKAGTRYVIFHLDMYDAALARRLLERLDTYAQYLRPLSQEGDVWLYEIVDWPELAHLRAALALLHTWPLATGPWRLSRLDNDDTAFNTWVIAWVRISCRATRCTCSTHRSSIPSRDTLAFSEHHAGPRRCIGAPLTGRGASPVLVYNLLVMAGFALSGFAMSWLISRWTGDRAAGVVAGSPTRSTPMCWRASPSPGDARAVPASRLLRAAAHPRRDARAVGARCWPWRWCCNR